MGLTALLCACSETLAPAGVTTAGSTGAATARVDASPCGDGRAWQEALGALQPAAVRHVEATYTRDTCSGTAQVSGTKLVLLPNAVESAQWAQLLECGAAHVRFMGTSASAETRSPAWTPEGRLDIAVEREGGNVVLTLSAESVPKNIRLFRSAAALLGPAPE